MKQRNVLGFVCGIVMASVFFARAQQPAAEKAPIVAVATIKPTPPDVQDELFTIRGRHVLTTNTSLMELIKFAFSLHPTQVEGAAEWMVKQPYDVDALVDVTGELNTDRMRDVIREILLQRFQLKYTLQDQPMPVFALVVAGQPRLKHTDRLPGQPVDLYGSHGELNVRNASMPEFAAGISRGLLARPVVDQTGLQGRYDFVLRWSPDDVQAPAASAPPGLFAAMQEELGLKLKAATAAVPVLHVESAVRPSRD